MAAETIDGRSSENKGKTIELLVIDEDKQVHYQGLCKLEIFSSSKVLVIEPQNKELNSVTIPFGNQLYNEKNIIYVFSPTNANNFIMIFNKDDTAKRTYNVVISKRGSSIEDISEVVINKGFLFHAFNTALTNIKVNLPFALKDFMKLSQNRTTENVIKLFKLKTLSSIFYEGIKDASNVTIKMEEDNNDIDDDEIPLDRKRRSFDSVEDMEIDEEEIISPSSSRAESELFASMASTTPQPPKKKKKVTSEVAAIPKLNQPLRSSHFQIVRSKTENRPFDKLIVFEANDRVLCHIYVYDEEAKIFRCEKCKNANDSEVTAKLIEKNGEESLVKLSGPEHICIPFKFFTKTPYPQPLSSSMAAAAQNPQSRPNNIGGYRPPEPIPTNIKLNKIIKLPDYELLKRRFDEKLIQKLVLFIPSNRKFCYELAWNELEKHFVCVRCKVMKVDVAAKLHRDEVNGDFVQCERDHVCQPIPYQPENLSFKIVKYPNYRVEIYTVRGIMKRNLIIFSGPTNCYTYFFVPAQNYYVCRECNKMKREVTAKLFQTPELGKYVKLSSEPHICQPHPKDRQLHPSLFKLYYDRNQEVSRICVFTNREKSQCYNFVHSNENIYRCNGCNVRGKICTISLVQNELGHFAVKVTNQLHLCKAYPVEITPMSLVRKPPILYHV